MVFNGSVPFPIGTQLSHHTVIAKPMIQYEADNIEVHDNTEGDWPTVITMQSEDHSVGVAVDYPGIWTNMGVQEIDLLLFYDNKEWYWRAVVAFTTRQNSVEHAQYEIEEYNGYELVKWSNDNRFERMEELIKKDKTPIAYSDERFEYSAHAMQEADNFNTLKQMFRLWNFNRLISRKERLLKKVVPREVRWDDDGDDEDFRDLARKILDDSQDDPQPRDKPYEVGEKVKVNDSDSDHHGLVGTVTNVLADSNEEEAERGLESYKYRIATDSGELDCLFRHQDLVPLP